MPKEAESDGKVSPLNALITALALVALSGLGILVGLIAMLLFNAVKHETIAIFSVFYLATLFAICFSITRLISKLIDTTPIKKTEKSESSQTPQLSMPTNPQLKEYQQPIGSVTDQTTRTFDEAFVKRN